MADKLGVPLSSYARYETPAKFKRSYLPMPLARDIARVLADHGVDPSEVMSLALDQVESITPHLSAGEEQLLENFRQLDPDQRGLLLQLSERMERRPGGTATSTLHDHSRGFSRLRPEAR